jgi:nitrate/nitrite transport system substrate-binding protein
MASMTGKFTFGDGDTRDTPEFNMFFSQGASFPYYSDAIWVMTQMRRWGQIPADKPDAWYLETAKAVYRPDLYMDAAKSLVADGKAPAGAFPESDGYRTYSKPGIDGLTFDAHTPSAYLASFKIGLKAGQTVTAAGVK